MTGIVTAATISLIIEGSLWYARGAISGGSHVLVVSTYHASDTALCANIGRDTLKSHNGACLQSDPETVFVACRNGKDLRLPLPLCEPEDGDENRLITRCIMTHLLRVHNVHNYTALFAPLSILICYSISGWLTLSICARPDLTYRGVSDPDRAYEKL